MITEGDSYEQEKEKRKAELAVQKSQSWEKAE
jgi:hypothetical protein